MTNGSYFGETDIIVRRRRTETVICYEECHLFYLSRLDFENIIINEFPHIYIEIKHLSFKREARNAEMIKIAVDKLRESLKKDTEENENVMSDDSRNYD
jgi:CRP-like cAMP-binding protein